MPVNVNTGTTAPALPQQTTPTQVSLLPLLARQPDYDRDFHVGGITINSTSVPLANGKRLAYQGDVFRRNTGTGLWDLVSGTSDDGSGDRYVMILHGRDCTGGHQSATGLLRSQHVNRGALMRAIPAALVGPNKAFEYMHASFVDTRG